MNARTIFTIGGASAAVLTCYAVLAIFIYSTDQTSRSKKVASANFSPGDLVTLKIGNIQGMVINAASNAVLICVPDSSGGVKNQVVSPMILQHRR